MKNQPEEEPKIECNIVISAEDEALKKRRELLFGPVAAEELDETRFGIALSGGGIRSATINLGFMRTLNLARLLKHADYLSTVSGGGYAGAYIHATLKGLGSEEASKNKTRADEYYQELFSETHINHLRSRGEYLIPGKGNIKTFNRFVLVIGYLSSLIMSLLSPALMVAIAYGVYGLVSGFVELDFEEFGNYAENVLIVGGIALGGILALHYALNRFKIYGLNISLKFHRAETISLALIAIAIAGASLMALQIQSVGAWQDLLQPLAICIAAIGFGYLVNPNASSFHRFYRGQLSEAFLKFAGTQKHQNIPLSKLYPPRKPAEKTEEKIQDYLNPYPLINTCLNLQASKDPKFQGTKTSDYFLLSPLYCGAKLTGYVETENHLGYSSMTLPAATTISAAALNPGMGIYSNKVLSVFLALFNARLGYWTWNPMKLRKGFSTVWWPPYFFYELLSRIGTDKKMLNISDGGHIENLAVYELLRRRCRLIIAVDAGEDARFEFADLENLTIRARNELGIDIKFFKGQDPEDVIRPKPSFGYSRKRFTVAGLYKIWEEFTLKRADEKDVEVLVNYRFLSHEMFAAYADRQNDAPDHVYLFDEKGCIELRVDIKDMPDNQAGADLLALAAKEAEARFEKEAAGKIGQEKLRLGTLVYVKSSVTAPPGKPNIPRGDELAYGTYKYKIYHPAFPHEPTSDQFFDRIQWEAYYKLGQHIAEEVLEGFTQKETTPALNLPVDLKALIAHFEPAPEKEDFLERGSVRGLVEEYTEEEVPQVPQKVEYKI